MLKKLAPGTGRKAGLPPGSLVHIGEKTRETTKIHCLDYDASRVDEKETETIEECFPYKDTPTVTWINVDSVHDPEILKKLGAAFGLHPLVLEDILNTDQRPKLEDYGEYLFVVLKMLSYQHDSESTIIEQVSLVLGPHYVISFQEQGKPGDVFDGIRARLKSGAGRIRKMGADFLAYSLLDALVDSYFIILERLGEKIELLEDELLSEPSTSTVGTIQHLRREMIFLRKAVWPLREVVSGLQRGESQLVSQPTGIYLRDVYDHTIHVIDTVETLRDMLSGMMDIYLSSISYKMNEVMKLLTVISTVFIPLTFMVGVYGMNFEYLPELKWHWAYPVLWGIMLGIAISMLIYFWRKKWL